MHSCDLWLIFAAIIIQKRHGFHGFESVKIREIRGIFSFGRIGMKAPSALSNACSLMEDYARRGVFRGFTTQRLRGGVTVFRFVWHRDRIFEIEIDPRNGTIAIPAALPGVPADSALYRDFKAFLKSHHDRSLPDHRRIDPAKTRLRCANRRGSVCITAAVKDGDLQYALQRLIHLIHETYVLFLVNGYQDYMVEQLGADPDLG
jgi:hypothetical protein